MEIVRKKILLEPFYSRSTGTIPFIGMEEGETYPSLNWGKIPYGVDFRKMDDEMLMGYGVEPDYCDEVKESLGKMTYAALINRYRAIQDFNYELYNYDVMYDDVKKQSDKAVAGFMREHLVKIGRPYTEFDPCCDNPCEFINETGETYEMDTLQEFYDTAVTANMNICLVQKAKLIGSYTFAAKEWVPGKMYFEGDKVIYNGVTYKLRPFEDEDIREISSSTVNCQGEPAMVARLIAKPEISQFSGYGELIEDDFIPVDKPESIVDLGYIYAKSGGMYYVRPSWTGYTYNEDGNVYFDEYNGSGITLRHWDVDETAYTYNEAEVSGCTAGTDIHISIDTGRTLKDDLIEMTGVTFESKLSNFLRIDRTIDDKNVEVKGRLAKDGDGNYYGVANLQYIIGSIKNIDTTVDSDDEAIGDFLAQVIIIPDSGNTKYLYPGDTIAEDTEIAGWASEDEPECMTGQIEFIYYVGATIKKEIVDKEYKFSYDDGDTGIVYKDTYPFTARHATAYIDNENIGYVYLDIDYESVKRPIALENLDNLMIDTILSEVTYKKGGEDISPDFQNSEYFMEDYQMGVAFVANNNENVYVDRGTAAAFERHLKLGEVNSMEDLENYSNGFFAMKN